MDEIVDIVNHLKLYLETQGIPQRNIDFADAALVKYFKTVKRVETDAYLEACNEMAGFIGFFIEYYRILKVTEEFFANF